MSQRRTAWLTGTSLLLAGCASAPAHFYTLQGNDGHLRCAVSVTCPDLPARADYAVVIGPVTVPTDVDRPQLVVHDREYRVTVLEEERWVEPLPSAIRRALASDLGERLRGALILEDSERSSHPNTFRLAVDVRRFDIAPAASVNLEADWLLIVGQRPVRQESARVIVPLHARGYDAAVAAASQAIAQLSDAIAASLAGASADLTAGVGG